MSQSLDESRRRLRSYLIPGGSGEGESPAFDDDHFPRSKVMRFAVNPRNRRIVMLAGSVLAVLATRAVGTSRFGVVADIARSFSRFRNSRS
ncbi:MAG: hypothetical protein ABIP38_00910 [Steroidobacteraceae bacterium]